MPSSDLAAADLWPAIADFTNPTRQPIQRAIIGEDGWTITGHHPPEMVPVPSLWDQLLQATGRAGGSGSAKPGSRPPVSVEAVFQVQQVEQEIAAVWRVAARKEYARRLSLVPPPLRAQDLAGEDRTRWIGALRACVVPPSDPSGDVPADLRHLQRRLRNDPLAAAALAVKIRTWITSARTALGLDRPQSSYVRVPCMACHARMHPELVEGEWKMRPALRLEWADDHARATICRACGDTRWPGDFHLIAEAAEFLARTQETVTSGFSMGNGWGVTVRDEDTAE